MIQETGPNHPTSLYIYTDQNSYQPLARIDRTGNQQEHIYYFHTDLNGMPEELTDEAGEIVWECSYQLWSKPIQEIAHTEIQQNLRYQGQYLDRETGLHYNTFRYYDPDTGRFTMPDPIGLRGGLNLYAYVPNPLKYIDPLGLCKTDKKNDGPSLPDSAWYKNAPNQVTPGTKELEHFKFNPKTGELEYSTVRYDQYGRQIERVDYTSHGYGNPSAPDYHSNPHTHNYEYGPGYSPKGKETRVNIGGN